MQFSADTLEKRFSKYMDSVNSLKTIRQHGKITEVVGLLIESTGPVASIGEVCNLLKDDGKEIGSAEVVGFRKDRTLLMPLGTVENIYPGLTVAATGHPLTVSVGEHLIGRVLNGLGQPMDDKGPLLPGRNRPVTSAVPNPLHRIRIAEPFHTGIRAIDSLLTVGKGQRMGIFAGSGVGKSVLLGMMARNCKSDINVIALIGERGREVREFLERDLGPEGMARSVVVVATSDQPALIRIKGALVAASIAEHFRDQGKNVLFMADSVTRLAMAQREIGLAVGEPPATKGYTPSVFSLLPQFLERAGNSDKGTITGLFTVLVEGDDMDDPIADTVRSILDGHIFLSRRLASRNHFPAIDILESISRCMNDVVSPEQIKIASIVKDSMAVYKENEDLIQIGAYAPGTSPRIDKAIKINEPLNSYLRQQVKTSCEFDNNIIALKEIAQKSGVIEQ